MIARVSVFVETKGVNVNAYAACAIPSGIKDEAVLAVRRSHLVAVATNLFIEKGFTEVSVSEIADASGMSIGSIYKYIRAKEDLLWLVMDSIYGRLEDMLVTERLETKDPARALKLSFQRLLYAVAAVRRGILLMYRAYQHLPKNAQREFMQREQRVVEIFVDILEEGNETGVFDCPSPRLAALNLLQTAYALAHKEWMLRDTELDDFVRDQTLLAFGMVSSKVAPDSIPDSTHSAEPAEQGAE